MVFHEDSIFGLMDSIGQLSSEVSPKFKVTCPEGTYAEVTLEGQPTSLCDVWSGSAKIIGKTAEGIAQIIADHLNEVLRGDK